MDAAASKGSHEVLASDLQLERSGEHFPSAQDEVPAEAVVQLQPLSIHVPEYPGDVGLCGDLSPEIVSVLAKRYKSWLYLNKEDSPSFHRKAIEEAGCQVVLSHFPGPKPTAEQAAAVLDALDKAPRPVMMQCNTGLRVGAALLYWLAKKRGYSADAASQLGHDMSLKFFTNCVRCGPMREWLLQQLPAISALGDKVQDDGGDLTFRQLFDADSSTFTYLLGDNESKDAILIDPVLEQKDRDLAMLRDLGLNLKYVMNTHCHADHITSGGIIRKELPHVKTMIAKASGAKADVHLVDGDKVSFGKFELETIATPGHTDGCCTYLLRGGHNMMFTGDALLIRGCGRTDFQQGNSGILYESIHNKIFSQHDETLVYPGHDYKGRNVSTVGEEKLYNTRLTQTKEGFIKLMSEMNLPYPKRIDVAVPANMVCGVQD